MRSKRGWLIRVVLVAVVFSTTWAGALGQGAKPTFYRLAELQDLLIYPDGLPENVEIVGALFVVCLPMNDLAVILRPISESEYGTYQIRAIGYEIIECQMLAAAIVLPHVAEEDVAGFDPELVRFLKQQVNVISGFEVFEAVTLSPTP